jgi:hypothetical protein
MWILDKKKFHISQRARRSQRKTTDYGFLDRINKIYLPFSRSAGQAAERQKESSLFEGIHLTFAGGELCSVCFIQPGPLPAPRAYRPEGRPLWAGGRKLTEKKIQ